MSKTNNPLPKTYIYGTIANSPSQLQGRYSYDNGWYTLEYRNSQNYFRQYYRPCRWYDVVKEIQSMKFMPQDNDIYVRLGMEDNEGIEMNIESLL